MSRLPLGSHVAFRSSNLDETKRGLASELPVRLLEFASTDRRLDARLHTVRLPHMALMYLRFGGDVVSVMGSLKSSFLVQIPLSGAVVVRSGRQELVSTPTLGWVTSPGDLTTVTWQRGCSAMAFRIEQRVLQSELADLIDGSLDDALRFWPGMDLSRELMRSWFDFAMFVASELDAAAGFFEHPSVAPFVERTLMRGLLLCQPNTYTARLEDDRRSSRPSHVQAAMRIMEQRPDQLFTVTSLAREVGVSARALQQGFRQHLGVTPMQFLRGVRLRRARLDLLAGDPESGTTVAETAYRWGFTHLGRFADYYRSRYGESPSQTLRRQ